MSTDVFDGVRQEFGRRLLAKDWVLLERRPFDPPDVGVFAVSMSQHDFIATAMVFKRSDRAVSGRLAISAVAVVGLDYAPARELTMALTGTAQSGVVLREPVCAIGLADRREVIAVDALVGFVCDQASALASIANVDKIVEMLEDERAVTAMDAAIVLKSDLSVMRPWYVAESLDPKIKLVAALLVGAEQYDRSKRFLSERLRPGWQQHASAQDRRFVRQLTRWIEHRGMLALPTTPARWPARPPRMDRAGSTMGLGRVFAQHQPEVEARNGAVEAVRAVSRGKTRDELRVLLKEELHKRQVGMDPVAFALAVDSIATAHERLGRTRVVLRALRVLRDLGSSIHSDIDEITMNELVQTGGCSLPEWLSTPERASYPISYPGSSRIAVELDQAAESWLNAAMKVLSAGASETCNIEVWLAADDGQAPSHTSRLSVHIGSRRVGHIYDGPIESIRPALEAAAERDEDVRIDAHLTRVPGDLPYVLDLPLPMTEHVTR